jgi:Ribosomal protein S6.
MQKARQYELIYIVTPESTEEMVADLQTQVEDVVSRFEAKIETLKTGASASLPMTSEL